MFWHLDLWPAGSALAVALLLVGIMRAAERWAQIAASRRTRQALERVLRDVERE
jgi:hypothetical protein